MKKIVLLIMALSMVLAAGCGPDERVAPDNGANTTGEAELTQQEQTPSDTSAQFVLARQETVQMAVQYSGDYLPFQDFYTQLENLGYKVYPMSRTTLNFRGDIHPTA